MPRDLPALQLQTLAHTNGLLAQRERERERALKLTALAQGGGQLTDGFSGSLGAAQVLTCNYEPFIGHNVNYTATQHSAHNTEALNHNPLNKTLKWAGATRDCNGLLPFGLNRHLYSFYQHVIGTNSAHVNLMYSSESELCLYITDTSRAQVGTGPQLECSLSL